MANVNPIAIKALILHIAEDPHVGVSWLALNYLDK